MSYTSVFRLLLIVQTILSIITPVIAYYSAMNIPKAVEEYLTQQSAHSVITQFWLATPTTMLIALGISLIVLLIVNLIGLWLWHNWARHLYLTMTILGFVILALDYNTPAIYSGLESLLWDILNIITGATIAMMYLPPLAEKFKVSGTTT
jgi:hypothetical protein